jgi:4-hydroxybenzoate polyprenyltransferase
MKSFRDVLRLTRIEHSIMLVIAVIAAEILAGFTFGLQTMVLSIIPPIFISAGAFTINDYYDIKADKANGETDRPLVSGAISRKEAIAIYLICNLVGIVSSFFLGLPAVVIVIIFAALSFLYSRWLKTTLFFGNAYVAFSMVIPFIYGSYIASNSMNGQITSICALIFLAGLAREIHGMVRDYHGDSAERKSKNLVYYFGEFGASISALVLYLMAIGISVFMLHYPQFGGNLVYVVPIAVTDIALLYLSFGYLVMMPWKGKSGKKGKAFFHLSRNLSLGVMALSTLAFLLAAIVHIPISI